MGLIQIKIEKDLFHSKVYKDYQKIRSFFADWNDKAANR